jgi:hypothetical protein
MEFAILYLCAVYLPELNAKAKLKADAKAKLELKIEHECKANFKVSDDLGFIRMKRGKTIPRERNHCCGINCTAKVTGNRHSINCSYGVCSTCCKIYLSKHPRNDPCMDPKHQPAVKVK